LQLLKVVEDVEDQPGGSQHALSTGPRMPVSSVLNGAMAWRRKETHRCAEFLTGVYKIAAGVSAKPLMSLQSLRRVVLGRSG
jgi:hypothetical protein